MIKSVKQLLAMLSRKERRKFYLLACAIIAMAFSEVAGIGSISPFLSVATNPDIIEENDFLRFIYERIEFETFNSFVAFLGVGVVVLILLRNATAAIVKFMEVRFGQMRNHSLSTRLLAKYLSHPYVFFLNHNTSELSQNVLSEVQILVNRFLIPCIELLARSVVAIAIIVFLVILNPMIAGLTTLTLGGAYSLVYILARKKLHRLGKKRLNMNRERYKIASEAFGGIKDVKLLGKEHVFIEEYKRPSRAMARAMAANEVIAAMPRFALETFAFSAVVLLISFLSLRGDLDQAIPLVGVYALAGYRLMPTMEQIFRHFAKIRGAQAVVEKLYGYLNAGVEDVRRYKSADIEPLKFNNSIELKDVRFRYPNTDVDVVRTHHLSIARNSVVGFVGPTGCGKTTLVDLILGLLFPVDGHISVDDIPVTKDNVKRWQANLGYVPQHIYLSDDTVAQNIAFGVPRKDIDLDRVRHVVQMANLQDFVENELPNAYDTIVGERGVRLSGGQRQRIGIARALYTDPSVLIMDEATSALDGITEQAIMEAIDTLAGKKTIILIAHRLSTLKDADCIFMMKKGEIVNSGVFEKLIKEDDQFKKMARMEK